MNGGGSERGRHRIRNRLQALSCQHRAPRGAPTHEPRDHDLSRSRKLNRLSHPDAPFFFVFFFMFIFETDREKQSASGGGAERDTQNLKQAPGPELSTQSFTWGSNSQASHEIMT